MAKKKRKKAVSRARKAVKARKAASKGRGKKAKKAVFKAKGKMGRAKAKKAAGGKKIKPSSRLLTPQQIVDYYRSHNSLPPELQRSVSK